MSDIDTMTNEELKQRIRVLENSRRVEILAAEHFRVLDNLQDECIAGVIAVGHQHTSVPEQLALHEVIQKLNECFDKYTRPPLPDLKEYSMVFTKEFVEGVNKIVREKHDN